MCIQGMAFGSHLNNRNVAFFSFFLESSYIHICKYISGKLEIHVNTYTYTRVRARAREEPERERSYRFLDDANYRDSISSANEVTVREVVGCSVADATDFIRSRWLTVEIVVYLTI